jgi:hypothetical protein
MLSLKDVYTAWKLHYTNRNQLLYKLHMVGLTVWLVVRYLIPLLIMQMLKPIVRYFKDLAAEQNGSIRSMKHRS